MAERIQIATHSQNITADISALAPGMYFVRLSNSDAKSWQKLIVE
jgi:hypothetical protein